MIPEELEWHEAGADVPVWALVLMAVGFCGVVLGAAGLIFMQSV